MPARLLLRLMSILAALLLVAGSGAAWAMIAIVLRGEAAWMALPAAVAAVIGAAGMVGAVGWRRALAAGLLTVLAATVAMYLKAGLLIAGGLGIEFVDALAVLGPEMAIAMARARLSPLEQATIVVCALSAAAVAWHQTSRRAAG
jgi:hypothetical protein